MRFKTLEEWNDWLEICELKARYCRFLDAKEWSAWRSLFSDDFVSDTTGATGGRRIEGADAFVSFVREQLGKTSRITSHQVHMPEIELTSSTTASGVWALEDVVRMSFLVSLHGRGYYTETYEKVDGRWYIKTSALTRLREDLFNGVFSLLLKPITRQV